MGSDDYHLQREQQQATINSEADSNKTNHMHKFKLYETYSVYFYCFIALSLIQTIYF